MKNKIIKLIVVGIIVSSFWYVYHPLPKYKGHVSIGGLNKSVDIYTDTYGVPHLFAQNEEDLFYAAGYYAARDRLFQMSVVNYSVRGELAYAFGDELIKSDVYLRTWRIHDTAKKLVGELNKETVDLIGAFCAGINYRIKEVYNDLPIEFKLTGMKPPVWSPAIVTGYSRMMAREMSSSWKPEVVFGAIENYFGKDKLREIYPYYGDNHPTIAEKNNIKKEIFSSIMSQELYLEKTLGYISSAAGSNNWVVSGSRTKSGKPLLANDPHLGFTQPPRWYEMHLKGGRFNVSGLCLAGIPMPIIGQNEHIAWGFTNSMVDDMDFFTETINPNNKNQYLYDGKWQDMKIIKETIRLKNNRDTTVTVRLTHHGPIITDVHNLLKNENIALSMAWTGNWLTKEIDGLFGLATSKNWSDFSRSVQQFGVPGQNIVYADVEGNIGWRPAVFLPIRKEGFSLTPRPGDDPNYDWSGIVPFTEMPFLLNPKKGYIATANNKTIDDTFPYYISGLWADPSRAQQIVARLDTMEKATVDEMKSIQLDYTSLFAKEITPHLLSIKTGNETGKLKEAMDLLEKWDFVESSKIVYKKNPNTHFFILGNPDKHSPDSIPHDWLKNLDSDNEHISWLEHTDNVKDFLSMIDVFVLPTYYPEGVPKSLLEAGAMSLPLITTNTPGCKEIVEDNYNGLIVNIKDQIDLAQKMYELSLEESKREEMGRMSRKVVEAEYDVKLVNNKTMELYIR